MINEVLPCLHCRNRPGSHPRRLCSLCYDKKEIRHLYPLEKRVHNFPRLGIGNINQLKLPEKPTDAVPGSEEKIRILCERASKGENLWHPQDRTVKKVSQDWIKSEWNLEEEKKGIEEARILMESRRLQGKLRRTGGDTDGEGEGGEKEEEGEREEIEEEEEKGGKKGKKKKRRRRIRYAGGVAPLPRVRVLKVLEGRKGSS